VGGEKDRGKKIRGAESYQAAKRLFAAREWQKRKKGTAFHATGDVGVAKKEVFLAMLPLSHAGVAKKRGLT
jgi:hypothetical protein